MRLFKRKWEKTAWYLNLVSSKWQERRCGMANPSAMKTCTHKNEIATLSTTYEIVVETYKEQSLQTLHKHFTHDYLNSQTLCFLRIVSFSSIPCSQVVFQRRLLLNKKYFVCHLLQQRVTSVNSVLDYDVSFCRLCEKQNRVVCIGRAELPRLDLSPIRIQWC